MTSFGQAGQSGGGSSRGREGKEQDGETGGLEGELNNGRGDLPWGFGSNGLYFSSML